MTPATPSAASPRVLAGRAGARTELRRRGTHVASAAAVLAWATPALAEPGFSLNVASDDRFRGRSISGERPVATASTSYDDVRGPYAGVSVTVVATREEGVQPLRSVQYLGYARRVGSVVTLDAGVTSRVYTRFFTGEYGRHLLEGYVGVIGRRVSSHLYLSPDYDGNGGNSAYLEADALLLERGRASLSSHLGLLAPPREPGRREATKEIDWRLSATRTFDRLSLTLQWVGSGPDHESNRWQSGALLGVTRSF